MMLVVTTSLTACSGDDDGGDEGGNIPATQQPSADKGKDNTKDLIVTGGLEDLTMSMSGSFSVTINGYVNLSDSMKLLYGGLIEFGIEVSLDKTFPSGMSYGYMDMPIYNTIKKSGTLMDNRQFRIAFEDLSADTTYYYRSYIQTGNNMPIYGAVEKFRTLSVEKGIQTLGLKAFTPDVLPQTSNTLLRFQLETSLGVFFSKDKSKLTYDNIKTYIDKHMDLFTSRQTEMSSPALYTPDISLYYSKNQDQHPDLDILCGPDYIPIESEDSYGLEIGATYYYCGFNNVGTYPVLGDIKQYTVKDMAKSFNVQIRQSDDTNSWIISASHPTDDYYYRIISDMVAENDNYSVTCNVKEEYKYGTFSELNIPYATFETLFKSSGEVAVFGFTYRSMLMSIPNDKATVLDKVAFAQYYGETITELKNSQIYYRLQVIAHMEDDILIGESKIPLSLPAVGEIEFEGDGTASSPYSVESALWNIKDKDQHLNNIYVKGIASYMGEYWTDDNGLYGIIQIETLLKGIGNKDWSEEDSRIVREQNKKIVVYIDDLYMENYLYKGSGYLYQVESSDSTTR